MLNDRCPPHKSSVEGAPPTGELKCACLVVPLLFQITPTSYTVCCAGGREAGLTSGKAGKTEATPQ